ncbi:MAG: SdpI family protein [Flavobacteriales bacterium]|nr:MAG: SdpI family protein [Flavobacteriales bacterium]
MDWELFIGATITAFLFIVSGLLWRRFPPKKINHFYGYRSRRSMANQEIWDHANTLGPKMFVYLGIILLVIGIISYSMYPNASPIISLFAMLIGIGAGMYWCETQLDKQFDKQGNPKKNP